MRRLPVSLPGPPRSAWLHQPCAAWAADLRRSRSTASAFHRFSIEQLSPDQVERIEYLLEARRRDGDRRAIAGTISSIILREPLRA